MISKRNDLLETSNNTQDSTSSKRQWMNAPRIVFSKPKLASMRAIAEEAQKVLDARFDERERKSDIRFDDRLVRTERYIDSRFGAFETRTDNRLETHERTDDGKLHQRSEDIVDRTDLMLQVLDRGSTSSVV